jgi:hypothetical protein
MNAKSAPLVGRTFKEGEWIKDGSEVKFPNHHVKVLSCIAAPTGDMAEKARGLGHPVSPSKPPMHGDGSTSKSSPTPMTNKGIAAESSSIHDSLVLGLDFSPGLDFFRQARSEFHATVHPTRNSSHFTMVVSFGRSIFRLTEDNISVALESVIEGLCDELKGLVIRDRVFSFTISCRRIGFMILQKKSMLVINSNASFIFGVEE